MVKAGEYILLKRASVVKLQEKKKKNPEDLNMSVGKEVEYFLPL